MKPFLVLYATREGHARRIAEHIARKLRDRGFDAEIVNATEPRTALPLQTYCAAMLVASVHRQKHEPEMTRFVKLHRTELGQLPCAFLSVSLSEAGAQNTSDPAEKRAKAAHDARRMIDNFLAETEWQPRLIEPVAGALMYTRYNVLLRYIMKRIARAAGGDTDTTRDFVYTDWSRLDKVVEMFAASAIRTEVTLAR